MSKRKGLSLEEKRTRMLELFYEKKDVLNYKELEKAAQCEKGIVSQSVKEIVQSLIADGLVDTDKIGTSVYYWAFPSKALAYRHNRKSDLKYMIEETAVKVHTSKDYIAYQKKLREDTPERKKLLAELDTLRKEKIDLTKLLDQYEECDPEIIAAEKKTVEDVVAAVNRWTDNVDNVRSWVKSKFGLTDMEFATHTGIPDDLVYISPDCV